MMGTVAMAQELIPGGKALGIKMLTDGVMVAGVQSVETKSGKVSPAEDAGIRKGDIITRIGAKDVSSAVDFTEAVQGLDGGKISVTSTVRARPASSMSLRRKQKTAPGSSALCCVTA